MEFVDIKEYEISGGEICSRQIFVEKKFGEGSGDNDEDR